MTTAARIAQDALSLILVESEGDDFDPGDIALAVRLMNDWCADKHGQGIDFGYKPVSAPDDIITSPADVDRSLKKVVAMECAPAFGVVISPDIREAAKDAESSLFNRYFEIEDSQLPNTLPRGSGNTAWYGDGYFDAFYGVSVPQSFLRLDASTTVSIATVDTPVQVTGPWVVARDINTSSTTTGAVTFNLNGSYLANLEASLTVNTASSDQFTFYFLKNGAVLEQSRLIFDADKAQNILVSWVGTLRDTDIITLWVENNSDVTDLTITNGHMRIS